MVLMGGRLGHSSAPTVPTRCGCRVLLKEVLCSRFSGAAPTAACGLVRITGTTLS
eukprot:m.3267 g.3267  ORF g.3267 m.3267 type:complete len:55 (+) comp2180_c0_seq1:146-310(+)